jgi:hypothetical protein
VPQIDSSRLGDALRETFVLNAAAAQANPWRTLPRLRVGRVLPLAGAQALSTTTRNTAQPSHHRRLAVQTAAASVLLVGAAPLLAQGYRCSTGAQTHISDRPCNLETKIGVYGPAERTAQPYSKRLPTPPKADEHLPYLGSGCSAINEAVRTAPSRGVGNEAINGLRDEYRRKCSMEDEDARKRVQEDKVAVRQTYVAQRDVAAAEQKQAGDRLHRCNAMRDVISTKRKRESEINAKEVEALRSLEKTYNSDCIAR